MAIKNKRVLVTCGPTWVPLDPVRVISNTSSGAMGQLLAEGLFKAGAKVTLLEGPVSFPLKNNRVRVRKFTFFSELEKLLTAETKRKYDVVIHAAAVSDYQLKKPAKGKTSSDAKEWTLRLTPTPKLIKLVKKYSPDSFLVGFKLESTHAALKTQANRLFTSAGCDLVVANSLKNGYHGFIINKNQTIIAQAASRLAMAKKLIHLLAEKL